MAIVVAFLLAVVAVGCGSGPGKSDGRDGERGADATNEETTAPEADRSAAKTTQEPVGLDVKVVSPGKGYMPAGFGEGSLWATNPETCEACAGPGKMLLKRLDPRSGEEVQAIPLKGFFAEITEVAFGAHRPPNRRGGDEDRSRPGRGRHRYRREFRSRVGRWAVPPQRLLRT